MDIRSTMRDPVILGSFLRGRAIRLLSMINQAWEAWEAGRIEKEFDPSLFDGSHQVTEMKRCVEVGLLCTQLEPEGRPTMANVVEMLHGHKELPVPKKPVWFQEDGNTSHPVWLRLYMATKKIAAQVLCGW